MNEEQTKQHSTIQAILAMMHGHFHQAIALQQDDQILVSVVRDDRQIDFIKMPHRSVNDDGSENEISPMILNVHLSEVLTNPRTLLHDHQSNGVDSERT